MEKLIGGKKFEFKDVCTMQDRQKCSNAVRQFSKTQDEFELCFNLFPIFCTKIDGSEMTDEQKSNYLKSMTDLGIFNEIQETLTGIIQQITDQKKKTTSNINSTDDQQLEK